MPKYYQQKVAGYYLYYTKFCIIEAMHAHASDKRMSEEGSAKFFIKPDGSTIVQESGRLTAHEIKVIQNFIKKHYLDMYETWSQDSDNGFYNK